MTHLSDTNKPEREMSESKDMVSFTGVQRSYPPGEEMAVRYVIEAGSDLKTSKRDWVGLFRVGWTSSRDYYTFEWAPQPDPESREGRVTFAGRRLPPEDGHFYQLCFVTRDGAVRGASAPFQFAPLSVSLEDMELVEVSDDSMKSVMVLQRKGNQEEVESLRRESREARAQLSEAQNSLAAAKTEGEALKEEFVLVGTELEQEKRKSAEKDGRIVELERELAVKGESERRISEQLSRERERSQELLAAKESEEGEVKTLKARVSAVEGDLVELSTEAEELRQQMKITESRAEDLGQLAGARGEELEAMTERLETAEARNTELHAVVAELRGELDHSQGELQQAEARNTELYAVVAELRGELERRQGELQQQQGSLQADISAALSQKDKQIERLEQDLACMQANVAELAGAQQGQITQGGAPPPRSVTVDKEAYDALQLAYENLEQYYGEEKKMKERVMGQLKGVQASHDDMVERVRQCEIEYKAKARECLDLQRQLKRGGKPQPTEQEHQEMVQNCQTAAAELSLRMKENNEMSKKISSLERELTKANQRYEQCEDRLDKKISEKNEEIQRLKLERNELKKKVDQLLVSIKKRAEESSRCCPVCGMKFPLRMSEQDFEKHVQQHFADETV